jgi:hypothetical protein
MALQDVNTQIWYKATMLILHHYMYYIVTHMTVTKQRLVRHISGVTLSTIEGHPLLDNESINTQY